jgi:hypothetical protein
MLHRWRALPVLVLSFVALACGGSDDTGQQQAGAVGCEPGSTQECSCSDGTVSTQTCSEDGTSYLDCACAPGTGGGSGGGATWSTGGTTSTTGGTGATNTGGGGTGGGIPTGGTGPNTGGTFNGTGGVSPTGGSGNVTGDDPTVDSASHTGPYPVQSYTSGYADSPAYGAATIWYPTSGTPPYAGVAVSPGWTEYQQHDDGPPSAARRRAHGRDRHHRERKHPGR